MDFKRQYLGEWQIDHQAEDFVKAWMIYHQTAEEIDGPHFYPNQRNIPAYAKNLAVRLGATAMHRYMRDGDIIKPNAIDDPEGWEKWQEAKKEALRRLGL